jgi:glyoxylase-like metal-dependent hydrolase (beta-lactamase superfamily II)
MALSPLVLVAASLWAWGFPPVAPVAEPASIFGPDPYLTQPPPDGMPRGSLDKEIIRRVIRRHINEVKSCYEKELATKPTLAGRIMVQFTIAASGKVVASVVQDSTMDNSRVETCTVEAVRGWEFPKPIGGGIVIVSYPFVLSPADTVLVAGSNGAGKVEVEDLGNRLVVHRSTDANGVPSNGLIFTTKDGLVLIDTAWNESQTEAILRYGDERLKLPWIGAVITHDHNDRAGGLGALFRRRIPVAALDLTVASLEKRGVRGVTTLFTAASGAHKDGRGFEAFYPGPGHAPDNIVLKIDEVVFGGCLIKSTAAGDLGFTGDANLAAWPAAVRRVADRYGKTTVVPGHGPVDATGAVYEHTLKLLAAQKR